LRKSRVTALLVRAPQVTFKCSNPLFLSLFLPLILYESIFLASSVIVALARFENVPNAVGPPNLARLEPRMEKLVHEFKELAVSVTVVFLTLTLSLGVTTAGIGVAVGVGVGKTIATLPGVG